MGGAAAALYGISQAAASAAIELRRNTREAGIDAEYYGKLTQASHHAGIGIEETVSGLKKAHATFESAALKGGFGESLFLKSLGLTDKQIAAGLDNAEDMVRTLGSKNLSNAQKAMLFGSVSAGNAALGAGKEQPGFFDISAGESRGAAMFKDNASNMLTKLGAAAEVTIEALWKWKTLDELTSKREDDARKEEQANIEADARRKRHEAGISLANQLASPAEIAEARIAAVGNLEFPGGGPGGQRFRALGTIAARQEQLSAQRPYMETREAAQQEWELTRAKAQHGGFSDDLQGRRAMIGVEARVNQALSPVLSLYERLQGQTSVGAQQWDVAEEAEARRRRGMNLPDLANMTQRRPGETDAEMKSRLRTPEQTDIARRLGGDVQSYADALTRAGGLAGAADMNTVGGYSQLVGAQEQMRQSTDSRAMAEILLQQLPKSIADAIRDNFGFEFRRPMGPMN